MGQICWQLVWRTLSPNFGLGPAGARGDGGLPGLGVAALQPPRARRGPAGAGGDRARCEEIALRVERGLASPRSRVFVSFSTKLQIQRATLRFPAVVALNLAFSVGFDEATDYAEQDIRCEMRNSVCPRTSPTCFRYD